MPDLIMTLAAFFIGLGLLITIHEYGHFLVARLCGVKTLCFSIGFGKPLIQRWGKDGTEYRLAMIPLGGYVKMLGERDEIIVSQDKSQDKSQAFNQKSVWARIAIVFAGPFFNFIFGFFAYVLMLIIGIQGLAPFVGSIQPGSIAQKAGLVAPLEIIAIDNKPTQTWQEVLNQIVPKIGNTSEVLKLSVRDLQGKQLYPFTRHYELSLKDWQLDAKNPDVIGSLGFEPLKPEYPVIVNSTIKNEVAEKAGILPGDQIISIDNIAITNANILVSELSKRAGIKTEITLVRNRNFDTPIRLWLSPSAKILKNGETVGHIGIMLKPIDLPKDWIRSQKFSFIDSLKPAYDQTVYYITLSFKLMWKMVTGHLSPSSLSGPIGIAQGAGASFKHGFQYYLGFLALISISLGTINLLPIPVLDGGHLFFYFIEIIIRRPVPQKVQEKFTILGLIFIVFLVVISFYNDITRLFN